MNCLFINMRLHAHAKCGAGLYPLLRPFCAHLESPQYGPARRTTNPTYVFKQVSKVHVPLAPIQIRSLDPARITHSSPFFIKPAARMSLSALGKALAQIFSRMGIPPTAGCDPDHRSFVRHLTCGRPQRRQLPARKQPRLKVHMTPYGNRFCFRTHRSTSDYCTGDIIGKWKMAGRSRFLRLMIHKQEYFLFT